MVEALLAGDAEEIARAVMEKAKAGDMIAARLVLDRIAPPRKGRAVALSLPRMESAADLAMAHAVVVEAMAGGEITTDEAVDAGKALELMGNALERRDLETRIAALEGRMKQ